MATLYDYFIKDFTTATLSRPRQLINSEGEVLGDVIARMHFDFTARAKFVSLYFGQMPAVNCPEAIALNQLVALMRDLTQGLSIEAGFGNERQNINDLLFSGQIYLYSERPVEEQHKARLQREAGTMRHRLIFRSEDYVKERNWFERPQAFICYDHRDKERIAQPLAVALQRKQCPVWFDEFSLHVGDNLRVQIEKGLKDCAKCILILTPHFLSNTRWSRREYDSIFTREIIQGEEVILPVWHGVSPEDVYHFSPSLAGKFSIHWTVGEEEVARKIVQAIKVSNHRNRSAD